MNAKTILIATSIFLLNVASALAHSGKSHVTGTVLTIDDRQLSVKDDAGQTVAIRLTRDTFYRRYGDASTATAADLKVGDHVVIDLFGMPGGEQTALEVRFSSSTAPAREPQDQRDPH